MVADMSDLSAIMYVADKKVSFEGQIQIVGNENDRQVRRRRNLTSTGTINEKHFMLTSQARGTMNSSLPVCAYNPRI